MIICDKFISCTIKGDFNKKNYAFPTNVISTISLSTQTLPIYFYNTYDIILALKSKNQMGLN